MNKAILAVFLLVAALTLPVNLYADGLTINIKAITPNIRKGEVPKFNVSITNSSSTSIKIIDVISGQDPKDIYTKLIVKNQENQLIFQLQYQILVHS
jgi:GH25 family lysozyme M1 (1,4-beta-N-acetylmuramidase)